MHDLSEAIEKCKELKELKEKLTDCLNGELSAKGAAGLDAQEAGEVVDMIKDLAETEKLCMEALYFQKVVEAMTSYEEPRYGESMGYAGGMGYNNNRYASGRYAPSGHGNMTMGYIPYMENQEIMGYSSGGSRGGQGGNSGGSSSSSSGGSSGGSGSGGGSGGGRSGYFMPDGNISEETPYGRAYNEYKRRRKYYTATNSPEDKREMEMNAEEHINSSIATIRDIWKDADTSLKKRMKDDFTKLLNDMVV